MATVSRSCANFQVVCLGVCPILLLLATPVFGNGGPVDGLTSSATGDVRPTKISQVHLVSERLTIDLGGDGKHYTVAAVYTLTNSIAPIDVTLGVPLVVGPKDMSECAGATDAWEGQCDAVRAAATVRLSLGDVQYRCRLAGEPKKLARKDVRQVWCIASLSIPQGHSIDLGLRYEGSFEFVDTKTTFSALREYGQRHMVYDFSPAGYWNGPVRDIEVRVNPGIFTELVRPLTPDGWRREGQSWILRGRNVDLRRIEELRLQANVEPILRATEIMAKRRGWLEWWGKTPIATSSSHLKSNKRFQYNAARLVDGRRNTAWCEGQEGLGIGEWVELRFAHPDEDDGESCELEGFGLLPGYTSSQSAFEQNARPTQLLVETCDGPQRAARFVLNERTHFRQSSDVIVLNPGFGGAATQRWPDESPCYRFRIVAASKGTRFADTCISEIVPIWNCG